MVWLKENYDGGRTIKILRDGPVRDYVRFGIAAHHMLDDYFDKPWEMIVEAMERMRCRLLIR